MPVGPDRRSRSRTACSAGTEGLSLSSGIAATPAISKPSHFSEKSTSHHTPEKMLELPQVGGLGKRAASDIRFSAAQMGTSSQSHCSPGPGSGSRVLREQASPCRREALATGRETEDENSAATVKKKKKKTTMVKENLNISSSKSVATCHGEVLSPRQTCSTTRDPRKKTVIGNDSAASLKATRNGVSSLHMDQPARLNRCSLLEPDHTNGASTAVASRPGKSRRTSVDTCVTHRSLLSAKQPVNDYLNPSVSSSASSECCKRPSSRSLEQQNQQNRCLFAEAPASTSPTAVLPPPLASTPCLAATSALLPSPARDSITETSRLTTAEVRSPRRCCGALSSQDAARSPLALSKTESSQQRRTTRGVASPRNTTDAAAAAEKTPCAFMRTQGLPSPSYDAAVFPCPAAPTTALPPAASTAALPPAASLSCSHFTPLPCVSAAPIPVFQPLSAAAMTAAATIPAATIAAATTAAATPAAATGTAAMSAAATNGTATSAAGVSFAAVRHARLSNGSSCLRHLRWWLRHRLRLGSSGLLHGNIRNTAHVTAAAWIAPTQSAAAAELAGNSTAAASGAVADASAAPSRPVSTATAVSMSHQPERKRGISSAADAASAAPPNAGDFSSTAGSTDASAAAFSGGTVEAVAAQLSHKLICCLLLKEKSSVLLLGPPGSGKTAAVELALRTVQQVAQQQRTQRMQQHQQEEQQQLYLNNEKATPRRYRGEDEEKRSDPARHEGGSLTAAVAKEVQSLFMERYRLASPAATGKPLIEASPASPLRCSRPLQSAAATGALEPPGTASKTTSQGRKDKISCTTAVGGGRSPLNGRGAAADLSGKCEIQQQQLPDLLVVRICCSLYPDETAMLHTIVLQLAQALHCQQQPAASASFEELSNMLRFILGDSCSVFSRAVVIVLDHFEVCCISPEAAGAAAGRSGGGWGFGVGGLALQHVSSNKRQQLLYCLFDLQHSSKLQLCTVCVSSILDITEYMEKRIRSRFSLQTLYVAGCPTAAHLLRFVEQQLLMLSPQQLLRVAADAAAAEQVFITWLDPTAAADSVEGKKQQREREKKDEDFAACVCLRRRKREEQETRYGGDKCAREEETDGVGDERAPRPAKETETGDEQIDERLQGDALGEDKGKICFPSAEAAGKTAAADGKNLQALGRAQTPKRRHVKKAAEEEYWRLASVAQTHTPQKTAIEVPKESAAETGTDAGDGIETAAAAAKDAETGAMFWERRNISADATPRKKKEASSASGGEAKETRQAIAVSSVWRGSHELVSRQEGISAVNTHSSSSIVAAAAAAGLGACANTIGICERSRIWHPTAQDRLVAEVFVAAYLAAVKEELSSPLFRMRFTRYTDLGRQPRFFFTLLVDHLLSGDPLTLSPSASVPLPSKSPVRSPCLHASSAATEDIDTAAAARPAGDCAAVATTVEPSTCSAAAARTHNSKLGFPLSEDLKESPSASAASAGAAALPALLQSSSSISPLRPAATGGLAFLEEPQQRQHTADGEDGPTDGLQDVDKETKTPTRVKSSAADSSSSSPGANCSPFSAALKDPLFVDMSPVPQGGGGAAAAREGKRSSSFLAAVVTAAQTKKTYHLFSQGRLLQDETGIEGVLEDLSLPEHFLLGAFTRLHEQRRFPKTLHLACEQLSHLFVHRHARQQQHHIAGLRRAFMRLLEMGVLRLCEVAAIQQTAAFSAVAAATADGVFSSCYLYYVPCKFPAYAKYREMLDVLRLPGELKAWVRSFDFFN